MSRWLPYAVLALAVVLYFFSSRGPNERPLPLAEKTSITFWAFSYPARTMQELKGAFEAEHPNLRVEVQTVAWEHLQQKTLWSIAANSNVPDVIVGSSEWIGGLASAGALAPLDTPELHEDFFRDYFPAALQIYRMPDVRASNDPSQRPLRQFAIPLDLDLMLVFYRADVLDPLLSRQGKKEFPKTWEELLQLGRIVRQELQTSQPPVRLLSLDPEDPVLLSLAFFPAAGARILSPDSRRATFNSPEGCAAFAFFYRLLAEQCAVRWDRSLMEDPLVLFKTTRALVSIAGPWYGKVLERRAPELAGRWRVALFPTRTPGLPSCAVGGACLAIPYNAPHRKEAIQLIRFMGRERFAMAYFQRIGSPPPQKSLWAEPVFSQPVPYFGNQKIYEVIRHAIETARPAELVPNTQITRDCLRRALRSIADGAPIQPTLDAAAAEVDLLLEQ